MAAVKAVKMGYRNVYWYKQGIAGWKAAFLYIESSDFAFRSRTLPRSITPGDLYQRIQDRDETIAIIDIRDEMTRKESGIIEGTSHHFPLYRLSSDHPKLPGGKIIVLLDIAGKQVPSACRYLMNKRYPITRILWLQGGFSAWKKAGLPVKDI